VRRFRRNRVVTEEDIAGTLEVAHLLQPDARRILAISGLESGQRLEQQARTHLHQIGRCHSRVLTGIPLLSWSVGICGAENTIILISRSFVIATTGRIRQRGAAYDQ
jgi:hypothetical protein